jgi:hypothetical protein
VELFVTKKTYIQNFRVDSPPVGATVRYECLSCGSVLKSQPTHAVACDCYNIIVDVDAGRFSVKDPLSLRVFVEE